MWRFSDDREGLKLGQFCLVGVEAGSATQPRILHAEVGVSSLGGRGGGVEMARSVNAGISYSWGVVARLTNLLLKFVVVKRYFVV